MPDTAQQRAVRNNGGDLVQPFGPSRERGKFVTRPFVRMRWLELLHKSIDLGTPQVCRVSCNSILTLRSIVLFNWSNDFRDMAANMV
jgi:hypothetical protein